MHVSYHRRVFKRLDDFRSQISGRMSRILTPPVASRWSSTHMQGTVQPRVQSPPWQAGLHGASTDECRSRAHRNCSQRAASLECRQPGPVGALQDRLVPGCRRQDDRIARVQRARAHRSDALCHGVETCRNRLASRAGRAVHAPGDSAWRIAACSAAVAVGEVGDGRGYRFSAAPSGW